MNTRRFSTVPILAAAFTFAAGTAFAEIHDATGKGKAGKSDKSTSTFTAHVPVVVMVPTTFRVDPEAKGCWVEMYSQENFEGDETLVGPVDMAKMQGPFGFNWENEVESIKTGPKATVTIYDNENFAERSERFGPNEEINDLDNSMELFDDFRSMKVAC